MNTAKRTGSFEEVKKQLYKAPAQLMLDLRFEKFIICGE